MRFFADGVLALCIRTQQNDSNMLDQWYGLFMLSTELDDERLMRLRLERLLCWRESPGRWSSYKHMLSMLILARSQRQRYHWQYAVEATALKLRLDPLAGALNWRTLATDESCHLQDLLKPLPHEALPPSRLDEDKEEERDAHSPSNAPLTSVSSGVSARLGRLMVGDVADLAAHITQDEMEEHEAIALLGLRLTPCQWSILSSLLGSPAALGRGAGGSSGSPTEVGALFAV